MSLLDELKKWTHPYEDEDEEYDDFEEPVRQNAFEDRKLKVEDRRNKVVNIHATTQLKVVLVKPERFENASEIADHLKDKRTVVLNLESTNKQDQEGGCQYIHHHALSCGYRGRPDRRAGEQRPLFLSGHEGVTSHYADTTGSFHPRLFQGSDGRI